MDEKLCRICCRDQGTVDLFNLQDEPNISARIRYFCVHVDIALGDGLPSMICIGCERDAANAYQFVLKCEATDRRLRGIYLLSTQPDPEDNNELKYNIKEEVNSFKPLFDSNDTDNSYDEKCDIPLSYLKLENTDVKTEIPAFLKTNEESKLHVIKPRKPYTKKKAKEKNESCTCHLCGYHATSPSVLELHLRLHTDKKPFQCDLCSNRFSNKYSLHTHWQRVHSECRARDFVCEHCGKCFFTKNDIKIHMRIHSGETPYSCPQCNKKFKQRSSQIRHEQRHFGIKMFVCETCSKSFATKTGLQTHFLVHTSDKLFSCPICKGAFKYRNSLRKHLKLHTEQNSFVCNYCRRTFSVKGNLKLHIKSQHSEKAGDCNICLKSFPNLEVHMRKHTGEKPFKCDLCASSYCHQNALTHHINFRHKNVNKYKCTTDGCLESFPSPAMLRFHEAKLHGTQIPFPCKLCPRGFYRKNDLARHLVQTHQERIK